MKITQYNIGHLKDTGIKWHKVPVTFDELIDIYWDKSKSTVILLNAWCRCCDEDSTLEARITPFSFIRQHVEE